MYPPHSRPIRATRTTTRPDRTRRRACGLLLLLLAAGLGGPAPAWGQVPPAAQTEARGPEPVLRIGIRVDVAQAILSCDGRVRLWRRGSGLRPSVLEAGKQLRVLPGAVSDAFWEASEGRGPLPGWGIVLSEVRRGRIGVFTEDLILEPITPGKPLYVDGRPYRGELIVHLTGPGTLAVINAVHIEDYLRGVVPAEIGTGPEVPRAALQAQAVAARSYALFYLGRHKEKGFDLMAGPEDQVYLGIAAETPDADEALASTRGVLAVHDGLPIRANYCSTCGGRTATSGRVWPGEDFSYLVARRDRSGGGGDLCAASPHYRWEEVWPARSFEKTLLYHLKQELSAAAAAGPTQIEGLKISKRTPSGRAEVLEVRTDRGRFRVCGDRIRWVLRQPNGRPLRSTLIGKLQKRGDGVGAELVLEGAGYGHGAGMCQYGARELARRGAAPAQILRHYYRDIGLVRWW